MRSFRAIVACCLLSTTAHGADSHARQCYLKLKKFAEELRKTPVDAVVPTFNWVIDGNSVSKYDQQEEIAKELNETAMLLGSFLSAPGEVRVRVSDLDKPHAVWLDTGDEGFGITIPYRLSDKFRIAGEIGTTFKHPTYSKAIAVHELAHLYVGTALHEKISMYRRVLFKRQLEENDRYRFLPGYYMELYADAVAVIQHEDPRTMQKSTSFLKDGTLVKRAWGRNFDNHVATQRLATDKHNFLEETRVEIGRLMSEHIGKRENKINFLKRLYSAIESELSAWTMDRDLSTLDQRTVNARLIDALHRELKASKPKDE